MNIRLGRWSKILAPAYSYCRRCKTPWRFVEPRTVWYTPCSGQFALCVKCWDDTTVEERILAHMVVSTQNGTDPVVMEDIIQAVKEESTHA